MNDTNGDIPVRVLLIGAEPSRELRADEHVELVRLRSAVDAVAELAAPEEPGDALSRRFVALSEGAIEAHDAAPFLAAAREADPHAVILLWRRDGSRPVNGLAHGFDAVVDGPLTRAALHGAHTSQPIVTPSAPVSTELPTGSALDLARESADLEILLTGGGVGNGGDSLDAFLGSLRWRLADPTLRFFENPEKAPKDAARALVERRATLFGVLTSARLNAHALTDAAIWLSRRLALGEQLRQLREAALTDPLTGAYNRRFFDRYLPHAIEQARAKRLEAHLLLIDIDNFKQFNDRYGHPAGDDILIETARMLKSVVRPGDKVCRIGGDEFAVVFFEPEGPRERPNAQGASGASGGAASNSAQSLSLSKVAARIQRVVCEKRFPKLGHDAPGQLSVSGGLATFPWDAIDPPSLIAKADQLALQSKQAGKSVITLGAGSKSCKQR